jgi:large subunit ribosomal protein L24
MIKLKIKSGDIVRVIAGDHKGAEGKVLRVYKEKNKAIVEGVNMVSKHTKPSAKNPQGGIVKKEAPINISNVMLWDAKAGAPTKVSRKREDGKLVRIAKKSGEVIK